MTRLRMGLKARIYTGFGVPVALAVVFRQDAGMLTPVGRVLAALQPRAA